MRDASDTFGPLPNSITPAAAASAGAAASTTSRRGASRSSGCSAQTIASDESSATFAANSEVVGAINIPARTPSDTA
jgi:hypothetical protein